MSKTKTKKARYLKLIRTPSCCEVAKEVAPSCARCGSLLWKKGWDENPYGLGYVPNHREDRHGNKVCFNGVCCEKRRVRAKAARERKRAPVS